MPDNPRLRRVLLDHFRAQGYRLVQPPLVEHLDSLFTGTGRDLELQTFKVVDPLSGRQANPLFLLSDVRHPVKTPASRGPRNGSNGRRGARGREHSRHG